MNQTVGQQLIIAAIPGLPALVFLVLVLIGRYIKEGAQYVAIFGVATSLVFSSFALLSVAGVISGGQPIAFAVNWIHLGDGGSFPMGVYIDGLAAVMLVVVCFVSLMIQLYSGAFMQDDKRFAWYYAVLNLFTASMLRLVLAPNFIELYVFWELVGLCSYLLIGHRFENPQVAKAAQKAFIVTRIGDAALFIGIIMFWRATGTTSYSGIFEAAQVGFIGGSLFTAAVVLVFVGAIGKSAQFPLHVWLPDAMEGPTPVSALIHAATMVAAGVYLVARTYDIFVQSPTAMLVVAYIGGFTALMAATMALTKSDIKRVIAYSTVSQLGYMMLALGIGSFTAGIFHLYNHAFFKALLFLCAGSIIYAMNSYNVFEMGGLRVFLTAFYIFRAIFLAFMGEPRTEAAQEAIESPGIMTGPMVILAFLSVVSGWVGIPEGFGLPLRDYFAEFVAPSDFAATTLALEPGSFSFLTAVLSVVVGLAGIALAYAFYVPKPEWASSLAHRFSPIYTFLDKGWYFDDIYNVLFVRPAMAIGRSVREFDLQVLNRLIWGIGRAFLRIGERLRPLQTGGAQNYALFMLISVLILGG